MDFFARCKFLTISSKSNAINLYEWRSSANDYGSKDWLEAGKIKGLRTLKEGGGAASGP